MNKCVLGIDLLRHTCINVVNVLGYVTLYRLLKKRKIILKAFIFPVYSSSSAFLSYVILNLNFIDYICGKITKSFSQLVWPPDKGKKGFYLVTQPPVVEQACISSIQLMYFSAE